MSKSRSITREIRLSQSFARLTLRQRDLWHGLIATADDQGRMPGIPAAVRSLVWPYDDIALQDVESDLQILDSLGNIMIYEISGAKYIQIVKWWHYQNMQWAGASQWPCPDGWLDRERFHGKGRVIATKNWDTPGGFCIVFEDKDNDDVNDNVKVKRSDKSYTTKVDNKGSQPPQEDTQERPNIYKLHEQNFGPLTPLLADQLKEAEDKYPFEWIEEAFKEAVAQGVRRWAYAKSILERWSRDGYKSDSRSKFTPKKGKRNGTQKAPALPATEMWLSDEEELAQWEASQRDIRARANA